MELGSCVQLYSLAETPQPPRIWPHYQDGRHLFVTPCRMKSGLLYGKVYLKVVELEEECHVGETVEEDGLDEHCDEVKYCT